MTVEELDQQMDSYFKRDVSQRRGEADADSGFALAYLVAGLSVTQSSSSSAV